MSDVNITKALVVKEQLAQMFPTAHCELHYQNTYELCIAVILSAQTTDKKVNQVTPRLFEKYPDLQSLSQANVDDVMVMIKQIGLYKSKSKRIIAFCQMVIEKYQGVIPLTIEKLIELPGVGLKTANAVVAEVGDGFGFAVDTHVMRVSKRLALVGLFDTPLIIEGKLKRMFDKTSWRKLHHQMIFMGRYLCHAKNPKCVTCPFKRLGICQYTTK